jgi:hypothetical protein
MNRIAFSATALILLSLSGCTTYIINLPKAPEVHEHKCYSAEDAQFHYHSTPPVVMAGIVPSPQAKSEKMSGCAAVKFQIDAKGKANNITVIREYPEGYGYGQAVSDAVRRSTYSVPQDPDDWYFVNSDNVLK